MRNLLILAAAIVLAAPSAADDAAVRAAVERMLPGQGPIDVGPSPLTGLREVAIGTRVFYVSDDGRYVLGGPLIDAGSRANLSEERVAKARRAILDAAEAPLYRYPARQPEHRVTIVTDIDCPYCRRLHNDMEAYNAAGFDVSYVMLPRAGRDSGSYRKTVAAACAAPPEQAITEAMNGATPSSEPCDHPIDAHMRLARELGVTSTPTIVLEDGRIVLGQKSPAELLAAIGAGDD